MNIDDVMANQLDDGAEKCVVCGKSVAGGKGYVRINREGQMVNLCCPLCQETYEREPHRFVKRQEARDALHKIFDLLRPNSDR